VSSPDLDQVQFQVHIPAGWCLEARSFTSDSTTLLLLFLLLPKQVKFKVTLRLTASQSVSLGVEPQLGLTTRCLLLFGSYGLDLWDALSDERTGLCFVYAAGPYQRSLFRIRVPWDSRSYFTVSDLRLPFSSSSMTRRVTVEVFDPASTRVNKRLYLSLYKPRARTPRKAQPALLRKCVYLSASWQWMSYCRVRVLQECVYRAVA
jgi:hypothetical protein